MCYFCWQIRRQAIKDLPHLCKDSTDHTARIGDILAQLLVLEDASELQQVHMSLQTLAKVSIFRSTHNLKAGVFVWCRPILILQTWLQYDAKGTLEGIIGQILNGDEPTRERCLRYLATKFRLLGADVITKEIETLLITEVKKILQVMSIYQKKKCLVFNKFCLFFTGCYCRRISFVYEHPWKYSSRSNCHWSLWASKADNGTGGLGRRSWAWHYRGSRRTLHSLCHSCSAIFFGMFEFIHPPSV